MMEWFCVNRKRNQRNVNCVCLCKDNGEFVEL